MILIYYEDYMMLKYHICGFTNFVLNKKVSSLPNCTAIGYGHFKITGCSKEYLDMMPSIVLQIDSYYYFIKAQNYLKFYPGIWN